MRIGRSNLMRAALAAAVIAGPGGAASQAPSLFEAPSETASAPGVKCYRFARYFVAERELAASVGADVLVRPLPGAASGPIDVTCAFDSLAGDYVVRNQWAEYFEGLHGDRLFLYSGTGPQGSLIVHDLVTRRRLIEIESDDLEAWRDSVTLVLWVRGDTVPHARCPRVPASLTAGVDSLEALDFRTLEYTALGPARCATWQ